MNFSFNKDSITMYAQIGTQWVAIGNGARIPIFSEPSCTIWWLEDNFLSVAPELLEWLADNKNDDLDLLALEETLMEMI